MEDRELEEPEEVLAGRGGLEEDQPAAESRVPRTKKFHRIASERLWGKRIDQYLILSGLGVSRSRAADHSVLVKDRSECQASVQSPSGWSVLQVAPRYWQRSRLRALDRPNLPTCRPLPREQMHLL